MAQDAYWTWDVTLALAKYFQRSRSRVDSEPEMRAEAQTLANIADVKNGSWDGSL